MWGFYSEGSKPSVCEMQKTQVEVGPVTTSGDMFERANWIAVQMALFVRQLWRPMNQLQVTAGQDCLQLFGDHC